MMRQYELVERVRAYDPQADEALLNRAYVYSLQKHGSQIRASGDPYFSHPLEVAGILTGLKLDSASIATALLHDVVEDTETTLDELTSLFGGEVARLVDGVTKLSRLELQSDATKHAENLRKLVLAMSEDIRVLLVKLADRLHNMRTLHYVKNPDKRRRIALETLEIYAPLAERIGMQQMKNELEDWAFTEINPDARQSILNRRAFLNAADGDLVGRVTAELEGLLQDAGVDGTVTGREKAPYSIWQKMQRKNVGFEQLSDVMAFRIIVPSVEDCYRALGILHSKYANVPGRFKDYISLPKPNGYKSIHTTVIGPQRQRIEVQIRTEQMHAVCEYGVAAHWSYKQGVLSPPDGSQFRWLRELLDVLDHASGPEEFLEHTKLAMYEDQVFVFTPKGDLHALPKGATPVDLAYAIHSELGDRCVGAKVNGRILPLRTALQNGDQVEILTSKAQTPSPTWERFVVTAKARARIRKFIRQTERSQYVELGRSILQKLFAEHGYEVTEKGLDGVLKALRQNTVEDLFANIGMGNLPARDVLYAVYPGLKPSAQQKVVPLPRAKQQRDKPGHRVPIRGLIPGMAVHFAGCCHPLPGDRIVGIVQSGRGITVHTIDCDRLEAYADEPERWIDVGWETDEDEDSIHVGRLHVLLANEPGTLGEMCNVIGKNKGNISNLRFVSRSEDFFELNVDIEVSDLRHLSNIMAAMRAQPQINHVERARG